MLCVIEGCCREDVVGVLGVGWLSCWWGLVHPVNIEKKGKDNWLHDQDLTHYGEGQMGRIL